MIKKRNILIGLLGHQHSGVYNPGYGQNSKYVEFFRKFGDVIILDALNDNVVPVDLLVLPGGRDVNPLRYYEKPHLKTQSPDLEYEWFFANMFNRYLQLVIDDKMAIYGICAGFQNLIVEFDGSLSQHIVQEQSEPRGKLTDKLKLNKDLLMSIDKKYYIDYYKNVNFNKTNSIHHQGAFEEQINNFEIVATNETYKNVEFILHPYLPIAAEQSHPEERENPLLTNLLIDKILKQINK